MILWLHDKRGYSTATRGLLGGILQKNGLAPGSIVWHTLHTKTPNLGVYQRKAPGKGLPADTSISAARHDLTQVINQLKPQLIVCNDEASLRAITQQPYTLATTRGSVYQFSGLPVLVLDDLQRMQYDPVSRFTTQLDFAKLLRHASGKSKRHPPFTYQLCASVNEVREHCARAKRANFVTCDTETASKFITVIAYTYDFDGGLVTFSVPFFDPAGPSGAYWSEPDEIAVRCLLRDLNASPVIKGFQNGSYDGAYLIKEAMPMNGYLIDSQNLMHCIWIEAPKRLHELASYFCDWYVYWKDDGKGVKEAGYGKNRDMILRYWRYCGLDTYWTWLVCYELLGKISKLEWACDNYNMEFALQVGPCLESSITGILADTNAHAHLMNKEVEKSIKGISDIKRLTQEDGFNLKSPRDVAWFLYDFCQQRPTRLQWTDPLKKGRKKYGPRSTDEKVLKIMKEQNNGLSFIARNFIDRLLAAKKPGTVLSNYQELNYLTMRGRFCHWHNAAGTDTFRFATGSNQFWIGRNSQNISGWLREWLRADPDWVFLSADYSASDDRFIAYESEDPAKMELVESGKDPHCFHASVFFSKPYDELVKGWKGKALWVVHPTTGVRQNTKRVTHGRNFRMEATTMYNTMGRDAVIATAFALGYTKAAAMTDKELIGICQILIEKYDNPNTGLYKRLRPWGDETVEAAKANGNKMTNCFGLTRWFLGSMDSHDTQRELASCYGQMGTAGNINRALREIYYGGTADAKCRFLQQGHDSLLFLIHKSVLRTKADEIIKIMEGRFVIHGRSIRIPVDAKVGLRWSEDMVGWKCGETDVTYQELVKFDDDTFGKKYPKRTKEVIIEQLLNMNFGGEVTDVTSEMMAGLQQPDEEEVDELEDGDLEGVD